MLMRESDSSLRMFLVSIQQDVRQTSAYRRAHEFYFRPFAGSVIIKAFRAYRTFATGFAVISNCAVQVYRQKRMNGVEMSDDN